MKTPVSSCFRLLLLCIFGTQIPVSAAETNTAPNLYLVRKNGWFGYVDRQGQTVIKPQYAEARGFKEGMACVKVEGKFGFIDASGKLIVQPQYLAADDFSEGRASVTLDGEKWGYVDSQGVLIIPAQFQVGQRYDGPMDNAQGAFSEGLAFVRLSGSRQSGYIDKRGNFVIQNEGLSGSPFSEGLAFATWAGFQDGRFVRTNGYIDRSGKQVIAGGDDDLSMPRRTPGSAFDGGAFHEGIAWLRTNEMTGFIDKQGRFVIQPKYPVRYFPEEGFSEGLCYVEEKHGDQHKIGYIDRSGKMIIPAKFDMASSFAEGLSAAYEGNPRDNSGKWGYINQKGEWVIPPKFTWARKFSGGLAIIEVGGRWERRSIMRTINDSKWALIDRTGKYVWGPE